MPRDRVQVTIAVCFPQDATSRVESTTFDVPADLLTAWPSSRWDQIQDRVSTKVSSEFVRVYSILTVPESTRLKD